MLGAGPLEVPLDEVSGVQHDVPSHWRRVTSALPERVREDEGPLLLASTNPTSAEAAFPYHSVTRSGVIGYCHGSTCGALNSFRKSELKFRTSNSTDCMC